MYRAVIFLLFLFTSTSAVSISDENRSSLEQVFATEKYGRIKVIAKVGFNPRLFFFKYDQYLWIKLDDLENRRQIDYFSGQIFGSTKKNNLFLVFQCRADREGKVAVKLVIHEKNRNVSIEKYIDQC